MNELLLNAPYNIRIIELDSVYQQLENPQVRKLFADLLLMRKRGYSSRHQSGALPIDTYDFIGTHYLLAIEQKDQLQVLGCIRMVKLSQAKIYNLAFPAMSLFASANATRHIDYMNLLMKERFQNNANTEFTYVSSWSFDPIIRNSPEVFETFYKLISTISVYSLQNPSQEIRIACGIPRLKTDQYIISTGFERAFDHEGVLSEVHQANLLGEPVVLLTLLEGHNFQYRRKAQEHQKLWEERIVLSPSTIERKKAA